jgi:transcriptional regulator with XRE-family HTH domain
MATDKDLSKSIVRKNFARRLKELRRARGVTSSQLARLIGISSSYVSRMELGMTDLPSREILGKLAEELDTTRADLLHAAGYLETSGIGGNPALEIAFRAVSQLPEEDQRSVLEFISYVMHRRRLRGLEGDEDKDMRRTHQREG